MWMKLLSKMDIKEAIKPQFVNGRWRGAALNGKDKANLKKCFRLAGLPWIYEPERPKIDENSPYNRKPKGHKKDLKYEMRLADIRRNLRNQDELYAKMRTEKANAKKLKGTDLMLDSLLPYLLGTNKGKKGSKIEDAPGEEDAALKKRSKAPIKQKGKRGPKRKDREAIENLEI
jgi:hypothetical protein